MGRTEPGPTAKINCLFSHCHIFGPFLVFWSSFQVTFFLANFYASSFTLCMLGICFVTDTLSTPTILVPYSLECQDPLIPTRFNACVATIDLGLKSHPNDCAMRYKSLAQGYYAMTNRNHVLCYHQLFLLQ